MKKMFFLSASFLALAFLIQAQDCTYYFPATKDATYETKSYNAKDKLTGSTKVTVLEKSGNAVKFHCEVFDDKGKQLSKGDYEVTCENGEFKIDMNQYLKGVDPTAYQGMEVKMDSKQMTIPSKLQAGQKLNDGEISMKVSNQFMTILNMVTKITNRKVESFQDMTVPAGTYKCAKLTYDVESKAIVNAKSKGVEYIAEKVGVVRSESYDEKGKLTSYSVMTSFKE